MFLCMILYIQFVILKLNSQFITSFVVCHGSELFTHMAKTNIHANSSTKSGTYVHVTKLIYFLTISQGDILVTGQLEVWD